MFRTCRPLLPIDHQLERVAGLGFKYADVTDNHPGGLLGNEFGFTGAISLDSNPADVKALFDKHGLTITSVCAHANLLDASSPAVYGTDEILKAIRLSAALGRAGCDHHRGRSAKQSGVISYRIPNACSSWQRSSMNQFGLPRHWEFVCCWSRMESSPTLSTVSRPSWRSWVTPKISGVNMDTGNSWIGGADPVEMSQDIQGHHLAHPLEGPTG